MKVLNFGANKEFTDRVPLEELYKKYHLTSDLIVENVLIGKYVGPQIDNFKINSK